MLLRSIYIVFLGILLATFIGVGIAAFYKAPKSPEYPTKLQSRTIPADVSKDASLAAQLDNEQIVYNNQQKEFVTRNELYNRNVSIISLIFAVLILILSLTFVKHIAVIADGLLLGSVLTLIYSIIRGFNSNDDIFRFLVVSVGLAFALIIGYIKFIQPAKK